MMTIEELIERLTEYKDRGLGGLPMYVYNASTGERSIATSISPTDWSEEVSRTNPLDINFIDIPPRSDRLREERREVVYSDPLDGNVRVVVREEWRGVWCVETQLYGELTETWKPVNRMRVDACDDREALEEARTLGFDFYKGLE